MRPFAKNEGELWTHDHDLPPPNDILDLVGNEM